MEKYQIAQRVKGQEHQLNKKNGKMELVDIFEDAIDIGPEKIIDADSYSVSITIGIHPSDGIGPDFPKEIPVVSTNSQNKNEVNVARTQAIKDYMYSINL